MRGWRDAGYARDRVTNAIKLFEKGKAKPVKEKERAAV
jgi:hypothetical protein